MSQRERRSSPIVVLWHEVGYFDRSAQFKPLLHLWSLGIEEQFYIFWPIFLRFFWNDRYRLLPVLIHFGRTFLCLERISGSYRTKRSVLLAYGANLGASSWRLNRWQQLPEEALTYGRGPTRAKDAGRTLLLVRVCSPFSVLPSFFQQAARFLAQWRSHRCWGPFSCWRAHLIRGSIALYCPVGPRCGSVLSATLYTFGIGRSYVFSEFLADKTLRRR